MESKSNDDDVTPQSPQDKEEKGNRDEADDSEQIITLNPPSPSPKKSNFNLGLKLGANGGRQDEDAKDTSETGAMVREAESEVMIIFELPDGSQTEESFKMGQSVEVLKSFVASEVGMPMEGQQLYLQDKLMFDPLSLMDFPEIVASRGEDVYIRVEGDLEGETRK
ncbi:hypothetical protein TrVE_jg14434 [Triparma verrucosa]|uniref:Ubiquitin-like domain-containing protein n=2 Tax=Triparma TaxID=722752 RepID=A0A9W7EAF4_9STRA|nr:hypothetical protein TrST_g6017 [Triparma strigata]GMH96501.1 hypothetical protein TrVE_jg14434 [Triparma verrucosa]